jgi:TolA-binding protein
MNRSLSIAIFAILLPHSLISAEPSAFGAGNLNISNPYGLTESEKALLENKKNLRNVVVKSNNQANEVDSLRERIDGIQSIIESLSLTSRNHELALKSIDKKDDEKINELINEKILVNSNEIKKINIAILEISKLLDKINAAYVSKDEFNSLVKNVNKFKDLVSKELKNVSSSNKKASKKLTNGDVATKAKTNYEKKNYTEAIQNYNYLIEHNYKPAKSHYMIGEIYFNMKNYADAIAYFKKSAKLYSKASYMHNLMLHTAISMDKTGDKKNAKTFYSAVISKYPQSSSAKIAKNKLSLIK